MATYEQPLLKSRDVGQIKAGPRSTLSLPNEVNLILKPRGPFQSELSYEKTKTLNEKATSPDAICFILKLLQAVYCTTATTICIVLSISCIYLQVSTVPEMCSVGIPSFEAVGQSTVSIIPGGSRLKHSFLSFSRFLYLPWVLCCSHTQARQFNASVDVPMLHFNASVPSPPFLPWLLWEGRNEQSPPDCMSCKSPNMMESISFHVTTNKAERSRVWQTHDGHEISSLCTEWLHKLMQKSRLQPGRAWATRSLEPPVRLTNQGVFRRHLFGGRMGQWHRCLSLAYSQSWLCNAQLKCFSATVTWTEVF